MQKGIVAQASVYRIETNLDLCRIRFNGRDYINADLEKDHVSSIVMKLSEEVKYSFTFGANNLVIRL